MFFSLLAERGSRQGDEGQCEVEEPVQSAREVLVLLDRQGLDAGRQRRGPFGHNRRMRDRPHGCCGAGGKRQENGKEKARDENHKAALGALCGGSGADTTVKS